MNKQEVFNRVVVHLLKQGKQAILPDSTAPVLMCAYRGKDGLKCAVGCLIPDEEYMPSFEGCSLERVRSLSRTLQSMNGKLLKHLQYVHDSVKPGYWYEELKEAAECFQLTMPTVREKGE